MNRRRKLARVDRRQLCQQDVEVRRGERLGQHRDLAEMLGHILQRRQIAGDEVMAIFVPGLAGGSYRAKAVRAGMSLLDAAGYGKSTPSWVDVGVGIASGEEFVGNVGGGGFKDFTAIGDVTNTAARLTSIAQAGEIVLDADTHDAVADDYRAERELLSLKGKEAAVEAFRVRPG